MDWSDEDDVLNESQEAALRQAEEAAYRQRSGGGGAQQQAAATAGAAPDTAGTGVSALGTAGAAPPLPPRRRKMPAILGLPPGSAPGAAPGGPAAPVPPAADEHLTRAPYYCGKLRYAFTPPEVEWLCQALLESGVAACGFDIGEAAAVLF